MTKARSATKGRPGQENGLAGHAARGEAAIKGASQTPWKPRVRFPTIMVPNPDGSWLAKPGRPIVLSDIIGTREAALILGISQRRMQDICDAGLVEVERTGFGKKPHYRISMASLMKHKETQE